MKITVTISVGEAFDKLSILYIKKEMIKDYAKLSYIDAEILELENAIIGVEHQQFFDKLLSTNKQLWLVNDKRKNLLHHQTINEDYISLTKQESDLNDLRYQIKKEIDNYFNSEIKEQKSYDWA